VIEVLYFSDKTVKQRLFALVTGARRLTLVTVIPPHRASKQPGQRAPFMSLERDHGDILDQVLVVDEGSVEGMWRDPVVDLADALYPDDNKAAYAAARAYFFGKEGRARKTVKKYGEPEDDLRFLLEALAKLEPKVRAPDAKKKPGRGLRKSAKVPAAETSVDEDASFDDEGSTTVEDALPPPPPTPPRATDVKMPVVSPPVGPDPFTVLGIAQTATLAEARAAWRALIIQYHPDKVAHLAPEFRSLAEQKTRAIQDAWTFVQAKLRSP
jgi:DnaJ-domain-containing protein 1